MTPRRPHIVLFNPDQCRADAIGHLGNGAACTPVLDALAREEAVSFRHAFCQNPVCTPSRCSFMTGWYPHVRGHRTMHHMLHPERGEPVLLARLKRLGYHVWWGGKNDLVPGGLGFEPYCDVKHQPPGPLRPDSHAAQEWRGPPDADNYYSFFRGELPPGPDGRYLDLDWGWVDGAVEHIRSCRDGRPMCIYLPLLFPHPPYAVEPMYLRRIDAARLPPRVPVPDGWRGKPALLRRLHELQRLGGWSEARFDALRRVYLGMVARVDDQLGRVVQALKDAGAWDDTALFVFSDHGDFTGDYGLVEKTQNTFEDCLTRVPFVVKPPRGVAAAPGVREALVELLDLPATIDDLLGVDPGYDHFGRSLLPLIAGGRDAHRDAVFCEGGRLASERHCSEAQSNPSLDPSHLYWPRMVAQRSDGPEHGKAVMCRTERWKYVRRLAEPDELYDLQSDPRELRNRIDDPSLAEVAGRLRDRMLRFFVETADVVPREADRR